MTHSKYNLDPLEQRQLFATLIPAETYQTSIKTPGLQKNWSITVSAGQNITLAAGDLSGGALSTELILISPANKVLRRSVGAAGSFISFNAPTTGTYRVRLRDSATDGAHTGSVKITAFYYSNNITDNDDAFTAESGRRRPATIDPGDLDVWTINASSNQFISFLTSENNAGNAVDIGMLLIKPDGTVFSGKESEKGAIIDFASTQAGKYYAIVYEPGANDTGRYGCAFAIAPGPVAQEDPDTQTPLPASTTRIGGLPSGDIDVFGISLTAGKKLTATFANDSGSINPELLVIDPTGKVAASSNASSTVTINLNITTSGTYSLVLRDRESDTGGNYSIRYALT